MKHYFKFLFLTVIAFAACNFSTNKANSHDAVRVIENKIDSLTILKSKKL